MRRRFMSDTKESFDVNNYMTIEAISDTVEIIMPRIVGCGIDGVGWSLLNQVKITKGQLASFKYELPKSAKFGAIIINGSCNLLGNCNSLIFDNEAQDKASIEGYEECFYSLFDGCSIVNVSPTFLPATTLADWCYSLMFRDCTSLTTAPELPATTLVDRCYSYMFQNCSKLNYIKALFTTTPNNLYTNWWVRGVASSGTFIKNKNATWDVTGDEGIPSGWTVLTE